MLTNLNHTKRQSCSKTYHFADVCKLTWKNTKVTHRKTKIDKSEVEGRETPREVSDLPLIIIVAFEYEIIADNN